MSAFLLFALCSFFASASAAAASKPTGFFDYGSFQSPAGVQDVVIQGQDSYTQSVNFNYKIDTTSTAKTSLIVSIDGCVFPTTDSSQIPTGDSNRGATGFYNTLSYPVLGALWSRYSTNAGEGKLYYRVETDVSKIQTWVYARNPQQSGTKSFTPVSAFVATWENMVDPSNYPPQNGKAAKTNTFQMVIAVDANGITYVFYQYGNIQWISNTMRVGYSDGVPATSGGSSYEYPGTGKTALRSVLPVFFKLSMAPNVDMNPAGTSGKATLNNQYFGQSFTATATSHGATAFNLFKGQNLYAYAVPGSTLYCFTSAYGGSAAGLATATNVHAKSNLIPSDSTTSTWIFPANRVFHAGTTYYCYCDTPLSISLAVTATSKRSPAGGYLSTVGGNTFPASTNNFAYNLQTVIVGAIQADPVFTSLRTGDNFVFPGEAGKIFNIYHDKYMNINAEFGEANTVTHEGTILKSIGMMVGGHKLSFSTDDFGSNSMQITLDGKAVKLVDAKIHLSGCVDIHYLEKWQSFYVVSPLHKLRFYADKRNNDHINTKFINIHIEDVPEGVEERALVGGVIGQTIRAGPINVKSEDFEVKSIYGVESSVNYAAVSFDC